MNNKFIKHICLFASIFCLFACGEETQTSSGHDNNNWFTESELSKVGLSGLSAPSNCKGVMSTDIYWFNEGYSFSQECENEDVLVENATTYLNYFIDKYDNLFGYTRSYITGEDTFYYYIINDKTLSSYRSDNPSPLYKFYYITNQNVDEEGYFVEDAVWSFEIRFEENKLKIFIENGNKNHSGMINFKYKIK
jgi:hypothetical protein